MSDNNSLSGLSPEEAKEFHSLYVTGFIGFTVIAIVAHILVWQWRPWFPSVEGYSMLIDGVNGTIQSVKSLIA